MRPALPVIQTRAIDHEAVFHVALQHPGIRLFDFLNWNHLTTSHTILCSPQKSSISWRFRLIRRSMTICTIARRFIIRLNTAGDGCGCSGKRAHSGRAVPSRFQQRRKRVQVVRRRLPVSKIKSKPFTVRGQLLLVLREHHLIRAHALLASAALSGDVVKSTVCAPNACANFTPMCPSPPSPTMPAFCPLPTFQCRSGEYVG